MKHNFRCGVPFIFLLSLIAFSHTSARLNLINTKPAGEKILVEVEESSDEINSFNEVMGMEEEEEEECGSEEEECLKRRVVAEAHLDYIYTQRHTP